METTSLQAYDELVDSGKLAARAAETFRIIRLYHPRGVTTLEISQFLGTIPSSVTGAIDRLKGDAEKGWPVRIQAGPKRPSQLTGKRSIHWVVAEPPHEIQLRAW